MVKDEDYIARLEKETIKQARKAIDLPPIKSGLTTCLRCSVGFMSYDIRSNRLCPYCKTRKGREFTEHYLGILD